MGRYDDVLQFLAAHEDKHEARMNRRTRLKPAEISKLRSTFPGIPEDYLDYLAEIGWGSFRECQYTVFSGLIDPIEIFDSETAASLERRVLCFGVSFSGDPGGFLPDENWELVEILHETLEICHTQKSFHAFIREQMLMGEDGKDLCGR